MDNGKTLSVIHAPWTSSNLKTNIGPKAGIYLRPIQYDTGLDVRKPVFGGFEQHRRKPACTSGQSDQPLVIQVLKCIILERATGEI